MNAREELSSLLHDVATGNSEAMAEVYRRTQAKLFGIVLRILNEHSEAEDVLQKVYITVWDRAGQFDSAKASPITWLGTIARNRALDRLRQRRSDRIVPSGSVPAVALESADPSPGALQSLERKEEAQLLEKCLDTLDQAAGAAIRSAFWGGISYRMLAEKVDVPLSTMKSRMRRALARLRDCLVHE